MELRNGDLAGIPPSSFLTKLICKVLGAHTFHFCMVIGKDKDGYICSESIGKGVVITRFAYENAYIYRIKRLYHEPETSRLVSIHSWQGEADYDNVGNFMTGVWFICKHFLKKAIPYIKNNKFNCQEWVIYLASSLGMTVIPETERPYCINLEKSECLEFIGKLESEKLEKED